MTTIRERSSRDPWVLPDALSQESFIFSRMKSGKTGVFLDYDGTLTPIHPDPHAALLSENMRTTLVELSHQTMLAIVSGRNKDNVQDLVQIPDIYYVGNHGFDIEGPKQNHLRLEVGLEWVPFLEECYREVHAQLMAIPGVQFEPKKLTVTIHHRFVEESQFKLVCEILHKTVARYPQLKITTGKKVLEIRPDMHWNKGQAVLWLAKQWELFSPDSFILFIGDDVTDEDAFYALPQNAAGILVGDHGGKTYADYHLQDTVQVKIFLDHLTQYLCNGRMI